MAFIYPLCSSSKGNCCYIGTESDGILIDAGVGIRNFAAQMALIGVPEQAVRAIFITHEHSDHISGLARLDAKLRVPVYTAPGTADELCRKRVMASEHLFFTQQETVLQNLSVVPFRTSHDAAESQGYRVTFESGEQVAVCTDLGLVSDTVHEAINGCKTVMIESNYEPDLLALGKYPYFLKQRIAGKFGHLSNADAAEEMRWLLQSGTEQFVLGHLSEENNRPDIAYHSAVEGLQQIGAALQQDYQLHVAPKTGIGKRIAL